MLGEPLVTSGCTRASKEERIPIFIEVEEDGISILKRPILNN